MTVDPRHGPTPRLPLALDAATRIASVERCLSGRDTPGRDLERALAEDARRSLAGFVAQHWHVLEPGTPLEWAWYHDLVCRELERVTAGETQSLLICIPPGTMKSLLASVFWLAWWWLREPQRRFLTLSSSDDLATRDSLRMRNVITSEWYTRILAVLSRRLTVDAWSMSRDQNTKVSFQNTATGGRMCYATGAGQITGQRGDGWLVDDPHQVVDVLGTSDQVAAALGKAHEKVDVVLPSRVNDQRTAWNVVIQQRVHEDDVAGRRLKDPTCRCVVLPMHAYDHGHPWRHPDDPREPGELLDPVRLPERVVARLAARLEVVPGQARAQLEQEPISPTGGVFKRAWMSQRYKHDPQRPPRKYTEVVVSVDATFKASKKSAYVSVQAWGRLGWTRYDLLGEVHERLSYVDTRQVLRDANTQWRPNAMLIEAKANGEALIDDLRGEIPSVVGFVPDRYGDKVARAQLATPMWAGGGVWLPDAEVAPWIGEYLNELAAFPGSLAKDRVDAMSQLFLWWAERRGGVQTGDAVVALMRGLVGG